MFLETWIMDLLNDIKEAANNNENYDLHMEASYVAEVAEAYDKAEWIEIY